MIGLGMHCLIVAKRFIQFLTPVRNSIKTIFKIFLKMYNFHLSHFPLSPVSQNSNSFPLFFFFQAEDGIRYDLVTGVQTCALPISTPVTMARSSGLWAAKSA